MGAIVELENINSLVISDFASLDLVNKYSPSRTEIGSHLLPDARFGVVDQTSIFLDIYIVV